MFLTSSSADEIAILGDKLDSLIEIAERNGIRIEDLADVEVIFET